MTIETVLTIFSVALNKTVAITHGSEYKVITRFDRSRGYTPRNLEYINTDETEIISFDEALKHII